jgi:hypothetical protein
MHSARQWLLPDPAGPSIRPLATPALLRFAFMIGALMIGAGGASAFAIEKPPDPALPCAASGVVYTRTTLYFGLARPAGTISEKQWKNFVRDEVTSRFPQGFTIWEAQGQWQNAEGRISRERSKVLLLIHPDTLDGRKSIETLIESYKRKFQQESVLWESTSVCAAF